MLLHNKMNHWDWDWESLGLGILLLLPQLLQLVLELGLPLLGSMVFEGSDKLLNLLLVLDGLLGVHLLLDLPVGVLKPVNLVVSVEGRDGKHHVDGKLAHLQLPVAHSYSCS